MRTSRDPTAEERPKSKPLHTERPTEKRIERPTERPIEKAIERPTKVQLRLETSKEKDSGRLRSTASGSRPLVKFREASEVAKNNEKKEEKKSTNILDRIVKPSDQLKRPLPQSKEHAKTEEAYDRVIKKVKPETTSE